MNYLLVQFTAKLKLKFQYFITLCTQDATAEVDDPTVAYSGDEPVPEAIPIPAQDPAEDSVGPSNISGYDKVVALADFLVSLKDSSGALTHQQTSTIIKLWNELSEYDRKPITFPARHQPQLVDGRFKASKKSTVVPGLDSTRRCFVGQNSGPATWPNCNRYVEVVHIKLCQIYPSPVKKNGTTTLQWTLVGNAYKKIREFIINNAHVMQHTGIQLPEVNQRTLTQW